MTRRGSLSPVPFVLLLLLAAGCRGDAVDEAPDHEVRISVAPTPPIVGSARVVVQLSDGEGLAVENAQVTLIGDMAHPGMTPVEEDLEQEGGGRYATSDFDFTMGGDWVLSARIQLPDGRRVERSRSVEVVSLDARDPT